MIRRTWTSPFRTQNEQLRLMCTFGFLWGITLILVALAGSVMIQYSAGIGWQPWGWSHTWRSIIGLMLVVAIFFVPIKVWYRHAYWLYLFNLILLILVPIWGTTSMGAQRWFAIGPFFLQPSEPIKIFTIMAIARYFHDLDYQEIPLFRRLFIPLILLILPVSFTVIQPDLGTSLTILFGGACVFFFAGVRWWKFASIIGMTIISAPLIWHYGMHEFQRERVRSFLDPEADLLGSGYQLMQSKIAIGSGGATGQGFLEGSQHMLGFIPAKHTDFVFALYAEQFGFTGSVALLILMFFIFLYGYQCSVASRSVFGKLFVQSFITLWLTQSIINVSMVMGLLPIVGIPLPFFSYGGTSLWTVLAGFGLILNVYLHQYDTLRAGIKQ